MTSEALSNLARIGKIKAEPMNRAEIERMLAMPDAHQHQQAKESSQPEKNLQKKFLRIFRPKKKGAKAP